jgi:hypothetical protein
MKNHAKLREEIRIHLCLKRKIVDLKKYVHYMERTNKAIRAAKIASLVPKTRIIATSVLKGLKLGQEIKTKSHLLNSKRLQECRGVFSKPILLETYSFKGRIRRLKDDTAKRSLKKVLHIRIFSIVNPLINVQVKLKNEGELKLVQNQNPMDSSYWKLAYGRVSSF